MSDDPTATRGRSKPPASEPPAEGQPSNDPTATRGRSKPAPAPPVSEPPAERQAAADPTATRGRLAPQSSPPPDGAPQPDPQGTVLRRRAPGSFPAAEVKVAPALASAPMAPVVLPDRRIEPPVYRPPGSRRRLVAAVGGLLLAGAGVALGYALHPQPTPPARATVAPPTLSGVVASGPAGALHCPSALLHVVGTITVTAATTVRYQWRLPDGTFTAVQTLTAAGPGPVTATLSYTLSGHGQQTGVATLHVLTPADVYSNPVAVAYRCP